MSAETVLVVNPMSAAGRTGRRLAELEALARDVCGPGVVVPTTSGGGHGRELAREAAEAGAGRLLAVGGDGTASEVVDG
ncbi:MAG: diacylglycerol kinase family lipid kinase, partial [Alphaproteobacteria bacterium]|nr:diacylglycerol kinase family lipid kinase [Alphaproteobacteria bacterium]